MPGDHYLRDVELRMMHAAQHLQELQRELTCLVDEGAEDPALEGVVKALPDLAAMRTLQLAVDHLRYFLWCVIEFIPDPSEEEIAQAGMKPGKLPSNLEFLSDAELLSLFCDRKSRKPN